MSAPFSYKDLGDLMGSWPFSVLQDPAPVQQLQPNSLLAKATLISTRRETTDGYNVGGLSLQVYADVAGIPTLHTVTFPAFGGTGGGGPNYFTLAEVIARFQASIPALPANTAQNSDRFLKLQSQTSGEVSYLRLESIPGAEGVFYELGLKSGLIVRGGDLKTAQHVDPSRQVAGAAQSALQHGETFSADVINRFLMQVAYNAGRDRGVLDLQRVAIRKESLFAASGAAGVQLNTGSPNQGVYTGPTASPSSDELFDQVVVLDLYDNIFVRETPFTLQGPFSDFVFSYDSDTGRHLCSSASVTFASTMVKSNEHIIATNLVGAATLNDIPLKIVEYISPTTVAIMPINPSTGNVVTITESGRTARLVRNFTVRCEVDGFYTDGTYTTRVEQQQIPIVSASGAVNHIEGRDTIFVPTADFTVGTKPGDLVTWTGASGTPYSNNGTYRVAQVLDAKKIKLVTSDYSPAYLNPSIGGGLGSVVVSTDGNFYRTPYVRFAPATGINLAAGRGAIPQTGENFKVVFLVESSLRSALNSNPSALRGSLRNEPSTTASVQAALMRALGPSVTRFDSILHANHDLSIEKLDFRLDKEHYDPTGRHSYIRPDVIDMFPNVTGTVVTVRGESGDAGTLEKIRYLKESSPGVYQGRFAIDNDGHVHIKTTGGFAAPATASAGTALIFEDETQPAQFSLRWAAGVGAGLSLLKLNVDDDGSAGTHYNALTLAHDGSVGVNLASVVPNDSVAGKAATNVHIRARSITDLELLRLEGFSNSQPTIALSFKPKPSQPIYYFNEVDLDTGNWYVNYAATQELENDSASTTTTFRWLTNVSGGSGREGLRVTNDITGIVDAGRSYLSFSFPFWPRYAASLDVASAVYLFRARVGTLGTHIGHSFLSKGDGGFESIWGCYREDTTQYRFDKIGANTHIFRNALDTTGATSATWKWQWAQDGAFAEPFLVASFVDAMSLLLSSVAATPNALAMDKGVFRVLNPGTASNPAMTVVPTKNTIYAKSMIKAWLRLKFTSGTVATDVTNNVDGVNIASVTPNPGGNVLFQILLSTPVDDYEKCGVIVHDHTIITADGPPSSVDAFKYIAVFASNSAINIYCRYIDQPSYSWITNPASFDSGTRGFTVIVLGAQA